MSHPGPETAPPASWERRHPSEREAWLLDFFNTDGSLGGFVGLSFHPDQRTAWYWAALVGGGRPYLLVRDLDVDLPRLPASREVRSEALWADLNCETPFEHWSLGLEAFGVAMDDPGEALVTERGERTGMGLDLEWEAAAQVEGGAGASEQFGVVHGEILVGGGGAVETIAFEGHGWRRHRWGRVEWLSTGASWLGGRLDDGTGHRLAPLTDEVEVRTLNRAPLLLEGGGRRATLERALCRFDDGRGGAGLGWAEWLSPLPAP